MDGEVQKAEDSELLYAAQRGDIECMRELLSGLELADVHAHNDAALHAAIIGNQVEALKLLIADGADVHAWRFRGNPLLRAVVTGRTEIILALLEAGADPHEMNNQAYDAAKDRKHQPEILEAFKEADRQNALGLTVSFAGSAFGKVPGARKDRDAVAPKLPIPTKPT